MDLLAPDAGRRGHDAGGRRGVFWPTTPTAGCRSCRHLRDPVRVPDAAGLHSGQRGAHRRQARRRRQRGRGRGQPQRRRPVAQVQLKLEERFGRCRPTRGRRCGRCSPLGLKYLELEPGRRGRELATGTPAAEPVEGHRSTWPPRSASSRPGTREVGQGGPGRPRGLARRGTGLVGLGTALAGPVAALAGVAPASAELGTGVAGRGAELNRVLEQAPELLARMRAREREPGRPADRPAPLRPRRRRRAGELAARAPSSAACSSAGEVTFAALAGQRGALEQAIAELPSTEIGRHARAGGGAAGARPTPPCSCATPGPACGCCARPRATSTWRCATASRCCGARPALSRRLRDRARRGRRARARPGDHRHAHASCAPPRCSADHAARVRRRPPRRAATTWRCSRATRRRWCRRATARGTWLRFVAVQAADEITAARRPGARAAREPLLEHRGAGPGRRVRGGQGAVPRRPADRQRAGQPGRRHRADLSPSSVDPPEAAR